MIILKTLKKMNKILLFALIFLAACAVPKKILYFEDAGTFSEQEVTQTYENKIQKDDVLSIFVNSKSPELTTPFNVSNATSSSNGTSESSGFIVDVQGNIIFPVIGNIHVEGLTYRELAAHIEKAIIDGGYINDPSVSVKLQNFKISVLGEVKSPGVKNISSERVTIFDVLGLAGDLTPYGQRENISIVREQNGKRELAYIDVNSKDIFDSPYYYLHPNDIVYVQPNKKQQRNSVSNPAVLSTIVSSVSLIMTVTNLIFTFSKF